MKEKMAKSIFRVIFAFLVTSATFFGYFHVNSQEIPNVEQFDKAKLIAQIEGVLANPEVQVVQEEVPQTVELVAEESIVEEPVVEEPVVIVPEQPVVIPSVPEGCEGSIEIAGSVKCLMKDQNGEHFYLNHNLNGVYDGIGVPYIDFRHNFEGRKTIIYSHSSTDGKGQFQILQNYHNNPDFYWNNRMININYQGQTYQYEIFTVYVSTADSEESEGLEYFHQNYYTSDEWATTIQKYRSRSEYDTGVSVSGDDQILILQTCSMDPNYRGKYYRYNLLVMGRLVY